MAELGRDLRDHQLGHRQPERPAQLAGDDLGHQRADALPGAAELHDVEPVVVGLDEPGHRAALPQGRDVSGGDHAAQLGRHGAHSGSARGGGARRPPRTTIAGPSEPESRSSLPSSWPCHAPLTPHRARGTQPTGSRWICPAELRSRLRLVVSELVTNAVRHGEGAIELRLWRDGTTVRGEVVDEGGGFEHEVRTEGWDDVGGRGLGIVERMTRRWGIREGTTHVWFELDPGGVRRARAIRSSDDRLAPRRARHVGSRADDGGSSSGGDRR